MFPIQFMSISQFYSKIFYSMTNSICLSIYL